MKKWPKQNGSVEWKRTQRLVRANIAAFSQVGIASYGEITVSIDEASPRSGDRKLPSRMQSRSAFLVSFSERARDRQ